MIGQNSHSNIGETEIDTDDNSINDVIEFLDLNLVDFSADFIKRPSESDTVNENLISQELEVFLKRRISDRLFWIKGQWEYSDDSNRKPDFGIFLVEDRNPFSLTKAFFEIEAKLLPSGSKDYVKGKYGGIERFKRGHHGKGLDQSSIIGYIQKENCKYWYSKKNSWIDELISTNKDETIEWKSVDRLSLNTDLGKTQKYISKNIRKINSKKDSILLWHYLIEITQN